MDKIQKKREYFQRVYGKAVEKHLSKLKAEDFIQREGPDKRGKWIVL